jgi:osmotically inducible protein OsmC
MPTSTASAVWNGKLRDGTGSFRAESSGAFEGKYTFATRFEGARGTNPEELLAAAHAACYSMALSLVLEQAGMTPERISTTAHCTIDKADGGFRISTMRLETRARVPGADADAFRRAAEQAKDGCPVSGALRNNLTIELDAVLEG